MSKDGQRERRGRRRGQRQLQREESASGSGVTVHKWTPNTPMMSWRLASKFKLARPLPWCDEDYMIIQGLSIITVVFYSGAGLCGYQSQMSSAAEKFDFFRPRVPVLLPRPRPRPRLPPLEEPEPRRDEVPAEEPPGHAVNLC